MDFTYICTVKGHISIFLGKSTWINSFVNYFYFDSLKEAIEGNKETPVVTIPTKFTFYKESIEHVIKFGNPNDNEVHASGASSTQG